MTNQQAEASQVNNVCDKSSSVKKRLQTWEKVHGTINPRSEYATLAVFEELCEHVTLNSNEILEALQEPLSLIVQAVKGALEQTPPELASDIAETGLVLTGGGALLRELDRLLSHETGLPVILAEEPLTCVARGGGRALELMDDMGESEILQIQ